MLYLYCLPTPSGESDDYWAGAKYKCDSVNMNLPSITQLKNIYANKSNFPSIAENDGWFWSSEEYSSGPQIRAVNVWFLDGFVDGNLKYGKRQVLCVGR